jgi:glyoxylate/hydroxypyruvate reductase A
MDAHPDLSVIISMGAGVDSLVKLRLPAGATVLRIDDGGMAVQMAEYACHAAIRHFREFAYYETSMAQGLWLPRQPRQRRDFPVGVMGLGALGARVARTLAAFDFPVNGWSRSPKSLNGVRCFSGETQLTDFLAATRMLICLLPLTPSTQDIMRRDTLMQLQPGAYVINMARGAHLVEEDLIGLLDCGHLAGATLDVFRTEPLPAGSPLRAHPRIALTPHVSAQTLREESIAQIADKLLALAEGRPVKGQVDTQLGY